MTIQTVLNIIKQKKCPSPEEAVRWQGSIRLGHQLRVYISFS